jgi:hypothetical protein
MAALLKDILNLAFNGTESVYEKEYFKAEFKEHLHLLDNSERIAFKIKEEIKEMPEDVICKMRSEALARRQKSDLRERKRHGRRLNRKLLKARQLTSDAAEKVRNLQELAAKNERDIETLGQIIESRWGGTPEFDSEAAVESEMINSESETVCP